MGTSTAEEWWGSNDWLATTTRKTTRSSEEDPECGPAVARTAWGDRSTWGWTRDRCETDTVSSIPRKEVIQPHLPVRLPCYDFVPIAGTTLGGCLHKG